MNKIITDEKKIKWILDRRIAKFIPSKEEVLNRFKKGEQLRVYYGIDPTGPYIHLGHTIQLLFLKDLYELHHKPILLIGDFTARIGDPTGKDTTRKPLTEEEIKENMKEYLSQIHKILPENSFELKYNSSWLSKMSFQDVIELASHLTVQQMSEREMFYKNLWKWRCPNCGEISKSLLQFGTQEAYDTAKLQDNVIKCPICHKTVPFEKKDIFSELKQRSVGLQEFLYPLMQGYDSVAMKVDGEVGGVDQLFNMSVGRTLEKEYLKKDKIVLGTKLLVDHAGKKMSKTEGNLIAISDLPNDIFGRVMAIPDGEAIRTVFELATDLDSDKYEKYDSYQEFAEKYLVKKEEENPKEFKKQVAFELVRMYHGEKEAEKARDEWDKVFSKGELPSEMEEVESRKLVELVGMVTQNSSSSAKTLIDQGAVRVNGEVKKEWNFTPQEGDVIQIGPRKFVRVKK